MRVSAWFFVGFWFQYQLFEASFGLFSPGRGGGGAFFAHVGEFVFGWVVTLAACRRAAARACQRRPEPPAWCPKGVRLPSLQVEATLKRWMTFWMPTPVR